MFVNGLALFIHLCILYFQVYYYNYLTIYETFLTLSKLAILSILLLSVIVLYSMLPTCLWLCHLGVGHSGPYTSPPKLLAASSAFYNATPKPKKARNNGQASSPQTIKPFGSDFYCTEPDLKQDRGQLDSVASLAGIQTGRCLSLLHWGRLCCVLWVARRYTKWYTQA